MDMLTTLAPLASLLALSPGGWAFMLVSIGFVLTLVVWCFKRVLSDDDDIEVPPASLGG